jgi:integrase
MKTMQTLVVTPAASVGQVTPGLVKIENDNGRLRLRFTYRGDRKSIAVGLPDSAINRIVAQQKANQIELDIAGRS